MSIASRTLTAVTLIRLEQHLEPELPEAREIGLPDVVLVDRAEFGVGRGLIEGALVVHRRVEDVVSLAAELESHPLRDLERLGEIHVELLEAGTSHLVRTNWREARCERLADDERRRCTAGVP
jgi:hypothetical protein